MSCKIFLNFEVIVKVIIDPDDNLKKQNFSINGLRCKIVATDINGSIAYSPLFSSVGHREVIEYEFVGIEYEYYVFIADAVSSSAALQDGDDSVHDGAGEEGVPGMESGAWFHWQGSPRPAEEANRGVETSLGYRERGKRIVR